ncbi:MAG: enoyl-CoA hydratase-related protein [Acidimicrobiales bacterium]
MARHFEHILVQPEDRFTTITMNRPGRRNALSLDHMNELIAALNDIAESEQTGVIIAGNGPVFSAGHDFADMAGADLPFMRHLLTTCAELMQLIGRVPQVVIAQVHGLATAAGCQLVAAADLAVAGESAGFAAPGGKGGWYCHTPMVTIGRAMGRKQAMEMAMTGDVIDPHTALQWGLINRVVPDDVVAEATRDLLSRATRGSRFSKALGKQTFNTQIELELPQAYRYATEVMASASQTADAQEGMASFMEKRRPTWQNR